ncbi:LLM class F420-dependent oxidoreductase [Nocardia cyriacigeorgica]|uniref:LLM class F420-dependent oxidoreductase n=1 Tax=Nocardia cyriacigeorgica TaxID=135487 RepID=UPI002457B23E|nr:LLM class F420-dependent oxidoreductase [Nocardia cyriacigeorgica]
MRFGMFVPQGWRLDLVGIEPRRQWPLIREFAQRADAGTEWESLWVYDHFHTVPVPTDEATHEAWSLVSALGAVTDRIRLGQMCTAMSYRNPAYLAKVAATADVISGGRIEMGIGGGWYEHEWRAYGYGFPPARERLGRLREGVQIFRQAWTEGRATMNGKYYQVDDAIVAPRPLQEGGIPIWIAGGGEKVTLAIAARYADYTNFDGTPEGFAHKSEVLRKHCAEAGTDFEAITRTADFNIAIGRTETEVQQRLDKLRDHLARFAPPEQVDASLSAFVGMPGVGTVEQVIANLSELRDLGMEYAICYFAEAAYDLTGIELFEREVIPALR